MAPSQIHVFALQQRWREEGHGNVQRTGSDSGHAAPKQPALPGRREDARSPRVGFEHAGYWHWSSLLAMDSLSMAITSSGTHPEKGTLRSRLWSPEGTTEAPAGRW